MSRNSLQKLDDIKSYIHTIRGRQVMLDRDLAGLYGVETKRLNEQVKRNINRFPEEFMFQLSKTELENWKSQFATSNLIKMGLRKLPFAFTEQGVAMLSAVLNSEKAVNVSIDIIKAFVSMRHFIQSNADIFKRLDTLEIKQLETEEKIENVLSAMENHQLHPKQGIFYNGQIFDAHNFVSDIVRSAEKSIVLIDNYIDDTVLILFSKRKLGVILKILTKNVTKQLQLDMKKFNEQFPSAEIKEFDLSHDRFMIIDGKALYHFGASLKDLGKKWFAFSKMDIEVTKMLERINY